MGAIAMIITLIIIANVGGIYFLIQDRKEAKKAKETMQLKVEQVMIFKIILLIVAVLAIVLVSGYAYGGFKTVYR